MSGKKDTTTEDSVEPAQQPKEVESGEGRPRRSWGPVLILLIIAGAIAFWFLAPGQLKNRVLSILPDVQKSAKITAPTATKAVVPPIKRPTPIQQVKTQPEPEPEPPAHPSVSSEEVKVLLSTIEALQQDLESLRSEQRAVHELQQQMQQMHLRTRLGWIIEPASRLPQIHLTWKEVSLLPFLSDDERSRASEMRALAAQRIQDIRAWQQQIQIWAEKLIVHSYDDIIPGSDNPWLNWVAKQFHLRQAPSAKESELIRMRNHLLKISRMMNLEQWPARGEWQHLRAELQLKLAAMQQQPDQAIDLGLPDDFTIIAQDITRLRQTARDWLEEL
ncbi:MAG: hypothetical protein ACE5F3_01870 [Mariprofundaceae bacterium]